MLVRFRLVEGAPDGGVGGSGSDSINDRKASRALDKTNGAGECGCSVERGRTMRSAHVRFRRPRATQVREAPGAAPQRATGQRFLAQSPCVPLSARGVSRVVHWTTGAL